ncbi:MAG: hypothetical protein IKS07_09770 [Lachnospiraceae bacterium]|nr:hypothetical protein [Lachnospiraceae bacterium]
MRRASQAYLTVYLTLTTAVLLSLCLALIEHARYAVIRLKTEIVMGTATESVLAEYHRELFRQYNLFAVDSSYGSAASGSARTALHLKGYLDRNLETGNVWMAQVLYRDLTGMSVREVRIPEVCLLTDAGGAVFRHRAAQAVFDDLGLAAARQALEWADTVQSSELEGLDVAELMDRAEQQLKNRKSLADEARRRATDAENAKRREEWQRESDSLRDRAQEDRSAAEEEPENATDDPPPEEILYLEEEYTSPVATIRETAGTGILGVLLEDPENLSKRELHPNVLIEGRTLDGQLSHGNLTPDLSGEWGDLMENALFREYLIRYFGYYGSTSDRDALWYQVEYLIAGKTVDTGNLSSVAMRLLTLRSAADYLALLQDEEKKVEAKALGMALALAVLCPELEEAFSQMILLGWALMEGRYDVKNLLSGGRIPLFKTPEQWHCSLTGALSGNLWEPGETPQEGLCYRDYLRVLLLLTGTDALTMRAMNLMEANIRMTKGNSLFRLDACIDCFYGEAVLESSFGYETIIRRAVSYG